MSISNLLATTLAAPHVPVAAGGIGGGRPPAPGPSPPPGRAIASSTWPKRSGPGGEAARAAAVSVRAAPVSVRAAAPVSAGRA
ncbi:hypothetical protein [Micromonospora sp. NPDC051141]|uniref:hypothetical protein n=1 Tax=Micromonospora sp. NPDC051141 TaxID=3364284 RepID=UPI0037B60869